MRKMDLSSRSEVVNINALLHMTSQTHVLVETSSVPRCGGRPYSFFRTQDHVVAGIAMAGTATVFDCNGGTLRESWWCGEQRHTLPGADGGQSSRVWNIHGSLYMTLRSGVLIYTLHVLVAAWLPWCRRRPVTSSGSRCGWQREGGHCHGSRMERRGAPEVLVAHRADTRDTRPL